MQKVVVIAGMNLDNQRRRQEDCIHKNDRVVPDKIRLNTRDNYARPHKGAPVSDDELSVDYLLVHPTI